MDVGAVYTAIYHELLVPASRLLEERLLGDLEGLDRVDRISVRAKKVKSFIKKAEKRVGSELKYHDPLSEIQDQLGARVVVFYKRDVSAVEQRLKKYLRPIEENLRVPKNDSEFGYFGKHFIMYVPSDIRAELKNDSRLPQVFEVQIKTLFQHAWAEAEHDLSYKPKRDLTPIERRKFAFAAAQAWGADQIFDELFDELGTVPLEGED